jgi:hypothetical protein
VIPDCQGRLAAAIKFIHANKKKKPKKERRNITSQVPSLMKTALPAIYTHQNK